MAYLVADTAQPVPHLLELRLTNEGHTRLYYLTWCLQRIEPPDRFLNRGE